MATAADTKPTRSRAKKSEATGSAPLGSAGTSTNLTGRG